MTMNEPRQAEDVSTAQLFREHGAFVARFLFRLGVPPHAIEDAVQDVFLVVHQRGGYRPGPAKPTTYLALIASRAACAQRRQQRLQIARQGNTQPEELHAQDDGPAVSVEQRDDLSRLQDALSRLDPPLRDTLLLAEFEDETAPAIARAMGVPVGTVYWRLHEARKKFRRALAVADASRAQAAAGRSASRRHASAALGRAAKLAIPFGLLSWNEARALFHATRGAATDFDQGRALQRHLELVAAQPAPSHVARPAASKFAWGAVSATLKGGMWAGAAILGTLASFQLLQRAPSVASLSDGERSAHALAVARAHSPAQAAPAPVQTSVSPHDVRSAAAEPEPPAPSLSPRTRPRGAAPRSQAGGRLRAAHSQDLSSPAAPASAGTTSASSLREAFDRVSPRDPSRRESSPAEAREPAAEAAPPAPARREDPLAQPRGAPADAHRPLPSPKPASLSAHDPLLEAQALARADRLLTTRPARALAIVEGLPPASDGAYLAEERHYIEVMALYGLGRRSEADRAADRFLAHYASSVFRERVGAARKAAPTAP